MAVTTVARRRGTAFVKSLPSDDDMTRVLVQLNAIIPRELPASPSQDAKEKKLSANRINEISGC